MTEPSARFPVQEIPGGARFAVHVVPRARQTAVEGLHGGALKIRVAAPPVDGAANEALTGFLADTLGVARGAVRVVRGGASRRKMVEVAGVTAEDVVRVLSAGV